MQGPNIPSIANPQTQNDEAYLTQGHILKNGPDDSLVFFTRAIQTKFGYLTRIWCCTAKGHWPFLSRNLVMF
jgi:hypothetical protein